MPTPREAAGTAQTLKRGQDEAGLLTQTVAVSVGSATRDLTLIIHVGRTCAEYQIFISLVCFHFRTRKILRKWVKTFISPLIKDNH